jgi:hypothetical protein
MKRSMGRSLAAFAAARVPGGILLWAFAAQIAMAQAPAQIETTMKNMLAATQANSLPDFVAAGDPAFKAGMTKPMLDGVSQQLAPRLKQGYTTSFLGKLNQQGFTVYLWKLEFKGGKDDVLVTLAAKDGQVGGFWLR